MNINGLGSTSWYTSVRSTTSQTGSTSSLDGSSDSVSFSAESLAALMQSAGPPPMTDDMVAKIGEQMQEKDSDLFGRLDSDSNGTLSAAEFKAGMQAEGRHDSGSPPPMTDEMASDFGAMLQEDDPELFSSLDSNSDGVLSADEMKAGKEQLDAAMQAKGMGPPVEEQSSGGLDEQQIQQLLQSLQDNGWSDVQTNQLSEVLNQLFATTG